MKVNEKIQHYRKIAGLSQEELGKKLLVSRQTVSLWEMDKTLLNGKQELMDTYRQRCITLGKEIKVIQGDSVMYGTALDLDGDGGLLVRFTDGSEKTVASGEVSVRGMYGYL